MDRFKSTNIRSRLRVVLKKNEKQFFPSYSRFSLWFLFEKESLRALVLLEIFKDYCLRNDLETTQEARKIVCNGILYKYID